MTFPIKLITEKDFTDESLSRNTTLLMLKEKLTMLNDIQNGLTAIELANVLVECLNKFDSRDEVRIMYLLAYLEESFYVAIEDKVSLNER